MLSPCLGWRAARRDTWGRGWQGPPHVSKGAGRFTQAQEFKVNLIDLEA